jgi:hypothetical protein
MGETGSCARAKEEEKEKEEEISAMIMTGKSDLKQFMSVLFTSLYIYISLFSRLYRLQPVSWLPATHR